MHLAYAEVLEEFQEELDAQYFIDQIKDQIQMMFHVSKFNTCGVALEKKCK